MSDAEYWRAVAQDLHRQLLAATEAAWDGPIYWLPISRAPVTVEQIRARADTLRNRAVEPQVHPPPVRSPRARPPKVDPRPRTPSPWANTPQRGVRPEVEWDRECMERLGHPSLLIRRIDPVAEEPGGVRWRRCRCGCVAEALPTTEPMPIPARPLRAWGVGDLVVPAPDCGHMPPDVKELAAEVPCGWCGGTNDLGVILVVRDGVAAALAICSSCAGAVPKLSLHLGVWVAPNDVEGVG